MSLRLLQLVSVPFGGLCVNDEAGPEKPELTRVYVNFFHHESDAFLHEEEGEGGVRFICAGNI